MQRLKKGDLVIVTSGNHKGQRGKIVRLLPERDAAIVEGVNKVKRHVRPQGERPGGIMSSEAPIRQCKLMPVDPTTNKPTRVSIKIQEGRKVRVAKSGAVIEVEES